MAVKVLIGLVRGRQDEVRMLAVIGGRTEYNRALLRGRASEEE